VASRIDELQREFENLKGVIQAVQDSVGGEIGNLQSETEKLAESVSGLEDLELASELDRLRAMEGRVERMEERMEASNMTRELTAASITEDMLEVIVEVIAEGISVDERTFCDVIHPWPIWHFTEFCAPQKDSFF
jgi:septation ring formation regulator EzrA